MRSLRFRPTIIPGSTRPAEIRNWKKNRPTNRFRTRTSPLLVQNPIDWPVGSRPSPSLRGPKATGLRKGERGVVRGVPLALWRGADPSIWKRRRHWGGCLKVDHARVFTTSRLLSDSCVVASRIEENRKASARSLATRQERLAEIARRRLIHSSYVRELSKVTTSFGRDLRDRRDSFTRSFLTSSSPLDSFYGQPAQEECIRSGYRGSHDEWRRKSTGIGPGNLSRAVRIWVGQRRRAEAADTLVGSRAGFRGSARSG